MSDMDELGTEPGVSFQEEQIAADMRLLHRLVRARHGHSFSFRYTAGESPLSRLEIVSRLGDLLKDAYTLGLGIDPEEEPRVTEPAPGVNVAGGWDGVHTDLGEEIVNILNDIADRSGGNPHE